MDLFFSVVDSGIIKLIGRWNSEKMFRYLHVQTYPFIRNFLQQMLMHGNYYSLPHQEEVPCF